MPCVSLRGGAFQVASKLVELVFETCTLVGPAVGAKTIINRLYRSFKKHLNLC